MRLKEKALGNIYYQLVFKYFKKNQEKAGFFSKNSFEKFFQFSLYSWGGGFQQF